MSDSPKPLSIEIAEVVKADRGRNYWYTPQNAVFPPSLPDMRTFDAIERYILPGWLPGAPFIGRQTNVTGFGSCFVSFVTDYIKSADYGDQSEPGRVDHVMINETLVTTFALRQLFEWKFEGIKPSADLLKGNRALDINYSDDLWADILAKLTTADVFFIIFSSAELWYDEPTGAVLWRETPGTNPDRQKFRTSSVEENRANLRAIYDLMRKHRPEAKLICALSPIHMIATHRTESCITANNVSKAVMRVALDELHREVGGEGHFFYWPLYDLTLDGFGATPYGGHFNGDRRHVNDVMLVYLARLFAQYYCLETAPKRSVLDLYVETKVHMGELPAELPEAVERGDRRALQHLVNRFLREDDRPVAEFVVRYAAERLGGPPASRASEDWTSTAVNWQALPGLENVGPAPLTLAIPPTAWDYGAASGPLLAGGPDDLLVQVRLRVLSGAAGVMLMRPDGSALDDRDQRVVPEDGLTTVTLRAYPSDGPAHILLRNHDNDGVAGSVEVLEVTTRFAAPCLPTIA